MKKLRVAQWRVALDIFHREYKVPWTRQRFAEALVDRAEELEAVDDDDALEALEDRLMVWMERQKERFANHAEAPAMQEPDRDCFANAWSEAYLQREIDELRERMRSFRRMIPREEGKRMAATVDKLESELKAGASRESVVDSLRALRGRVIARCFRSLEAVSGLGSLERFLPFIADNGVQPAIGPYNRRVAFAETLGEIKATDPIWIGDLVALYGQLYEQERRMS